MLSAYGTRRRTEVGDVLVREGERDRDFFVILAGKVIEIRELVGEDGELEAVVVEDHHTKERHRFEAALLFVFIGAQPCTSWLSGTLALDKGGYVLTRTGACEDGREPQVLETSWPGVLAVGDVRAGRSSGLPRRWARGRWRFA